METNTIKPAAHARARPRLINIDQLGTQAPANPDVKQAVVFGRFDSGFHHWLHYGRNEKRAYSPQKS